MNLSYASKENNKLRKRLCVSHPRSGFRRVDVKCVLEKKSIQNNTQLTQFNRLRLKAYFSRRCQFAQRSLLAGSINTS